MGNQNINTEYYSIEPSMYVDENADGFTYIGTSKSFKDSSKPLWKIKRIGRYGNTWDFSYPNGNQGFDFVWDLRQTYDYK